MATYDLIILSSSPPAASAARLHATPPSSQQRVGMSAYAPSPLSPLASETTRSLGASEPAAHAVPSPDGAARGFATARGLYRSHHFNREPDGRSTGLPCAQPHRSDLTADGEEGGQSKRRAPRTKTAGAADGAEPAQRKPRPRKPKADNGRHAGTRVSATATATTATTATSPIPADFDIAGVNIPTDGSTPPAAKPRSTKPRKPRTKQNETATTLEKKNNTKTKRVPKSGPTALKKTTGAVSEHFETSTVCADEAVTRRRDWTPVKDTYSGNTLTTDSIDKEKALSAPPRDNSTFTSMLSSFALAGMEPFSVAVSQRISTEGAAGMKKRRVELIDVPANKSVSRNTSPEKGKAPKKKARTITDLVTGQYPPPEPATDLPSVTSEFFSASTATTKVHLNDVSDTPLGKARRKPTGKLSSSKSSTNREPKSKKASAKSSAKPKMVADKLLSPASAILKLNQQDMLFGTSSQLALEESPTMIRQIQQAIRESEQETYPQGIDSAENMASRSRIMERLGKMEGKRRLWTASARDEDGQLFAKQNDLYIPEPDRTADLPLLMGESHDTNDSSFLDINDFPLPSARELSELPNASNSSHIGRHGVTNDALTDMAPADIESFQSPPPSNQNVSSSFPDINDLVPSASCPTSQLPCPPLVSGSTTQKSRARPPKSSSAVQCSPARFVRVRAAYEKPMGTRTLRPPSTPPRPKSRFADIEEILDSEDDDALSPTPPRAARFYESLPLPLAPSQPSLIGGNPKEAYEDPDTTLVPIFKVSASQVAWDGIKPSIFRLLTSHIHSIQPTSDPSNPSWHEKILMYDPIVLEDFTAYLNAKTSIRTYKRATREQVKAWNRKMQLNGDEILSVEKESDDVLVVKKDLETWMVQSWCQEFSICCITKGGRVRGGMGKSCY